MTLQDQRVLILGGTAGIGLATARAARTQGAKVIVTARKDGELAKTVQELGEGTQAERLDATQPDQLASVFRKVDKFDHPVLSLSAGPAGAGVSRRQCSPAAGRSPPINRAMTGT